MNGTRNPRLRSSLRTGGALALAMGLVLAAPASAKAATADATSAQAEVDDAALIELGRKVEAQRKTATRMALDLLARALGRSAQRAQGARQRAEQVLTWGYGFQTLLYLDDSVFEAPTEARSGR
ncbi:MAG: hypothetical protein KDK70_39830, partial [Myxococcales bacterium]|nr:hypothetical protein [Myxococcales bacterium]